MKKYYCFFIAFIFTTAFLHHTASAQWIQTNGPYGGFIDCLASDGTNIFAGTHEGGVYLSTNNGQSWSAANSGLPIGSLISIAINGSMIFGAAVDNGVFLSTNNGSNWSAVNSGLANRIVWCIAVKDSLILAGTDNGVFIYNESGSRWMHTSVPLPNTNNVRGLAFGVGKIFAGMDGSGDGFCSTDTGKSWTKLNLESHGTISCIVVHEPNVYIGTGEGVFVSADSGATWTLGSGIFGNVNSLAVNDSVIIAASEIDIFKSINNGYSWVQNNSTESMGENFSAVSCGSSFFVGTQNSIFRSDDNGKNWTLATTGLCAMKITCFDASNGKLFAGGWLGGIYTSSDNGQSWTHDYSSVMWAAGITALAVSPTIGGTGFPNIYAGSLGQGVFISSDNGQNWSDRSNGLDKRVDALVIHSTTDSFILFAGTQTGVFVSVDSGKSWTADGLKDMLVWSLAVNDSCLFAGTSPMWSDTTQSYSNIGGVYSSTNSGTSWNLSGLPYHMIFSLTFANGNLIAETPDSFFVSTDGGQSWAPLNTTSPNIQNTKINCIATVNDNIFAGTEGKSVWRRPISDITTSVEVNGKTFPTHYSLQQNYPNPFNPTTIIEFELPKNAKVVLKVYDLLGREVRVLVDEKVEAGFHTVKFDASRLASGIYFTRMLVQPQNGSNPFVQVRKMLMLR